MSEKISAMAALTGANVAKNSDYMPIIDAGEADADKNKRILIRELRPALFSGCRARKAADQTTADYDPSVAIAFDGTDDFDTDGYHDPSSNNTRMTIPASLNITKVRLTCMVDCTLITANSQMVLSFRKNGTLTMPLQVWANPLTEAYGHGSLIDTCVDGDYWEVLMFCQDASITVVAAQTYFAIEAIG